MIHDGTWYSFILHLATEKQRLYNRDLLDKSMKITRVNPNISKYDNYVLCCNFSNLVN